MKMNKEKAIEAQNKYCNMLTWNIWKKNLTQVIKMNFIRTQLLEPPWKKSNMVCVICIKKLSMKKMVEQIYLERAHWAQVKLLWENILK